MASIPETLIPVVHSGASIVPRFLTEADHPWLRVLLDERARFAGRRQRELEVRLREPLPCVAPRPKLALAIQVLRGLGDSRVVAAVSPRQARAAVFEAAARSVAASGSSDPEANTRAEILEQVAAALGVTSDVLDECLFADLPGERIVSVLEGVRSPSDLAFRANQSLVRALLSRSTRVRVEVSGQTRPVVRYAKLRGLIVNVVSSPNAEAAGRGPAAFATLEISGPLSLFRRTFLYGRAIADLLPVLAWCGRFRLTAEVILKNGPGTFEIATGAPIFPSAEPVAFDSNLEERFARDFLKRAPLWDLQREPEPIPLRAGVHADAESASTGATLLFPDFALQHRLDPARRWLLEIVGFWTPDYLSKKLARLRAAGLDNLILCIDSKRNCAEADFPPDARIIRYSRRIDPAEVLAIVDPHSNR